MGGYYTTTCFSFDTTSRYITISTTLEFAAPYISSLQPRKRKIRFSDTEYDFEKFDFPVEKECEAKRGIGTRPDQNRPDSRDHKRQAGKRVL